MKKILIFSLIFALLLSMAGCGCSHQWEDATCMAPQTCALCGETQGELGQHVPGTQAVSAVDTENLTITYSVPCSLCGEVMEETTSSTGVAPANGVIAMSAEEWFACLTTNIRQFGATQTLVPHGAESEDNAYVQGVVSFAGLKAAITFRDKDGTTLTTDMSSQRDLVNTLCLEVQFSNDTAKEFFMLLMLTAITNNSALDFNAANDLADRIMGFETVEDNGYTYSMEIVSQITQTVRVLITAK